jgi:CDP-diglyceride synthetase
MSMDDIPVWLLFVLTTLLIVGAIEAGYLLGRTARRKSEDEKESPVGAIVGTVLAMLAFILAFTFGMVSDRYDSRKALVREHASAIRDSYSRADFLPEPLRNQAKPLYDDYIAIVVEAADIDNFDNLPVLITDAQDMQQQLWNIAVGNVRAGDNSDISAMYVESINHMSNVLADRIAVSVQARIPTGIWIVLYALVILGMAAVGYQTAIADSRRTWAMLILALSFSIVMVVIAALDDPERGYLPVSQKPLTDLQAQLARDAQS